MSFLGVLSEKLNKHNVPYDFMRWTSDLIYPYWVGEYNEVPTTYENGYKETNFILTGTTRNDWLELEEQKELIERIFPADGGFYFATEKGRGVIFYENAFPIPTGEADLKRMQINLKIKEWKVN